MILAAVSINVAFNTGIIDTAVNGAVNYAEAQRQEQVTFDELDSNLQDILNRINEYDIGGTVPTERPNLPTQEPDTPLQDGSWDSKKQVNTPKVEGTGLIPVYHNGTTWVDLTENSPESEWAKWYDYENKRWANARSADGSMWVWIPRYEYKIQSGNKIDVRFISTEAKKGATGYVTDVNGIVKSSDDYIVHPAFMNDSANGYSNGGWKSDIEGFWVAKYPAGWQNGQGTSSITANGYTVKKSTTVKYETSGSNTSYAGSTASGQAISYPVFKANTYAYNYISVGDAYKISAEIAKATDVYGINSTVDSHLEKNSEWGAVSYLAHSKYGVNGQDKVTQNTTNKNNSPTGIYAVTSPESTTNTSTTQNITGVYDLSGCVYERVAGFYQGGTTSYTTGMPTTSSSEYVALYTANDKKGDATNETSGWNGDFAVFVTSGNPVFSRDGCFSVSAAGAGLFHFDYGNGAPHYRSGFRAVLVP